MKNLKPLAALAVVIVFCVLFFSCSKLGDFLHDHPDADIRHCSIQKFYTTSDIHPGPREAVFAYNKWGDPVSITVNNPGTGNPNRLFVYDKWRRLTDYIGAYTNGSNEFWQRLVYDAQGTVIRDTVFIFGDPVDYDHANSYVNSYEYDDHKRIIKVTKRFALGSTYPTEIFHYTYDGNGNLVNPGDVYDNEINFHRTHKIWMFLDRDYSVNNPFTADTYNSNHLPTKLVANKLREFLRIGYSQETTWTYACK